MCPTTHMSWMTHSPSSPFQASQSMSVWLWPKALNASVTVSDSVYDDGPSSRSGCDNAASSVAR